MFIYSGLCINSLAIITVVCSHFLDAMHFIKHFTTTGCYWLLYVSINCGAHFLSAGFVQFHVIVLNIQYI